MRTYHRSWLRRTATVLLIVMGLCAIAPPVQGGMVPSTLVAIEGSQPADLAKVQQVLEQKMVKERLVAMGFTQGEIEKRMQRLSDAEVHQFAQQSDQLMAGGDPGVITILLIVLLVLLILRLA